MPAPAPKGKGKAKATETKDTKEMRLVCGGSEPTANPPADILFSGDALINSIVLFKWPPVDGGWARGSITARNTNKKQKFNGVLANFVVTYEDGETGWHHLSAETYSADPNAKAYAWCILPVLRLT